MDTETSVAARRDVFVRTLVDEGFVDLARLVDMVGTPRTVAVAATRPEDADVLWGFDPPRSLDQSLIGAGGAQLITVDDAYLAGIAGGERQRAARAALGAHTSVAVPLRARGRMVGLLVTGRVGDSPRLEEDDAALLGEIGQRAAIALDNAALLASRAGHHPAARAPAAGHGGAVGRAQPPRGRPRRGPPAPRAARHRRGGGVAAPRRRARVAPQRGLPDRGGVGAVADRRAHPVHRHRPRRRAALHHRPRRGPPRLPGDLAGRARPPAAARVAAAGGARTGWAPSPSASPLASCPPTIARSRSPSPTSARTPSSARACSRPSRSRGAPRRGSRTSWRRSRARPPPRRSPP